MRELKYLIVIREGHPDYPSAILFNGLINHVDMQPQGFKTVSAGFCMVRGTSLGNFLITVWGNSASMGIESHPGNDEDIIRKTLDRTILFI